MNRSNPIPIRLRDKFRAWMRRHDHAELPERARLDTLWMAADQFVRQHRLGSACSNTAAQQYMRMVAAK